jgi:hypothetical protein
MDETKNPSGVRSRSGPLTDMGGAFKDIEILWMKKEK